MKRVRYFYAAALVLSAALAIATTATAQNGLPPLIDREIFFGNPEIASAQISPDGQFIAFRKPYKDTMNLWVKKAGEPFDKARLITAETKRPIRGYFWSRDSKYILFVNDFGAMKTSTYSQSIQPLLRQQVRMFLLRGISPT